MTEETKHIYITIVDQTRAQRLRFSLINYVSPFALIFIGWAIGSTAMQWWGFVFAAIIAAILGRNFLEPNEGLTIDQARKRLDEIEGVDR